MIEILTKITIVVVENREPYYFITIRRCKEAPLFLRTCKEAPIFLSSYY